ncbi:MAG: HAMP domain-containing sensor histidine kinase [Gemmatimonadota bacterium]
METEQGIRAASVWLQREPVGSADSQAIVDSLVILATHEKWEVRRAVALVAGECRHAGLDALLARLAADANARVQQAAQSSSLRRRDWRAAGLLGREHERRLEGILEAIYIRFGAQGRAAVYRAASDMTNTFARELYHEVIKYLTPLEREVEELRKLLAAEADARVVERVRRVEQDVEQVNAVLNAMREYAALPDLEYSSEGVRGLLDEAIRTTDGVSETMRVEIRNRVDASLEFVVSRTRFVQALSNVLHNAVEAYSGLIDRRPIEIDAEVCEGAILIRVRDCGCGMIPEALADARTLFSSSKPQGTGVGLPLAIKIVESEHEGTLNIESKVGDGTLIAIAVPQFRSGTR